MKRKTIRYLLPLSLFILVCVPALSQVSPDVYQITAFDHNLNRNNADQWVRIINPGLNGENICADIYVFDDTQELLECCSCPISANGLLTLSLRNDLTANPITSQAPDKGVIKIVSSSTCIATSPAPTPNLRAWISHYELIVGLTSAGSSAYSDASFDRSSLSSYEQSFLGQACAFAQYLGSGKGVCKCPAAP